MFTPCANSKLKHKRDKKQTETQCWEEEEQENHGNKILEDPSLKGGLIKKTKLQECDESMGPEEDGTTMMGLAGIPVAPCYRGSKGGIYFVLQNASLVAAYVGKRYQILNPDEHANFLRRKNKNPYDYRPDIVHEALLQIMGSRLCMAGRVHGVFIKTDEGILIRVEPNTQIPKTLGSFCNMMAELLQKFSIKSKGNRGKLLRLIENPVTQHLPVNSRKIGLSVSSPKAVQINDYVAAANHDENLVFVVGAMAHGKIDAEYVDDLISVSALPLSAGTCLRRICVALERNQKIH
ncbi:hypothetical protein HN51_047049 [Arachis hypogaea]|nr:ribosomal RNA small subunit methyltransferase nep-1 isoform X1 [Arachis ipaensis]XP_016183031.1 ribosomal RNA small subunit methyltransferase nep-1 isoform X1 [Arachis ipaensis]XP_029146488.1 ribosomal RNA small subunit methyltransferase nep-1 isoform X1 [Arachis hypogaea]XP_029146489.1 ribosomal RNA small subunit methyltransferase nep-1 isoform X1 [Arachis hypogaea]QHO23301.1 Ribosomal RNA small subunit methyltransferase [Arachis hypogaea]QHO23302.1 Ribosomal RNA small subunit methyltransf